MRQLTRVQARRRLMAGGAGPAGSHRPSRVARAPRWAVNAVEAFGLDVEPGRLARIVAVVVLGVLTVAVVVGGPVLVGVIALAGLSAVVVLVDLGRGRADRRVDADLPVLLDGVSGGVRAGLGLPVALSRRVPREHGPLRNDLAAVAAGLDAGLPIEACLVRWRTHRPTPGVRLATAALGLCSTLGGRARPLDGVASTLRDRLAVDREIRAASAQARASAVVLVATPWVFLGFTAMQDPEVLPFLVGQPVGIACLVAGVALDAVGAWLLARIVKGVA